MDKRLMIIILAIIVAFVGLVFYSKAQEANQPAATGSNNVYGKGDSPVTLTEFIDFQCEACYSYYPTIKEVKELYKDKVKFQVKNFPISSGHKFARMAAGYAEAAARQDKFWEMHDKILEGQKTWQLSSDASEYFKQYAEEIGLDMAKLDVDVKSSSVSATINADLKEVQELGGNGTPTFVLNGKKLDNIDNSVEAFSKVLDNALAEHGSMEN